MVKKDIDKTATDVKDMFQPALISDLPKEIDLEYLLQEVGASSLIVNDVAYRYINGYFYAYANKMEGVRICLPSPKMVSNTRYDYSVSLVYFDGTNGIWVSDATIITDRRIESSDLYYNAKYKICTSFNIVRRGSWKYVKRLNLGKGMLFLQDQSELYKILEAYNSYTADWALKNHYDYGMVLLAPYVEVLHKAGYAFVTELMDNPSDVNLWTLFGRICQAGTKPQSIFKVDKAVYDSLKNERSLSIWDKYRKMIKMGRMTPSTVAQVRMLGFTDQQLEQAHYILGAKYEGKSVFTWTSLVNYLQRLDTFEAIECDNALSLLKDYLSMCQQMEVRPRVDGDSLRREHDVLARLVRLRYNAEQVERMNARFNQSVKKMAELNYEENVFLVRSVESIDDLYDEAKQQRNCVASYANNIVKGDSYIFFMREVANPAKSLITIEVDPITLDIRQQFLACNQPIRNKEQSEFIARWSKRIKSPALTA